MAAIRTADRLDLVDALGTSDGLRDALEMPGVVDADVDRLAILNRKVASSGRPRRAVIAIPADSPAANHADVPEVVYLV